jgi:hypothetical protein
LAGRTGERRGRSGGPRPNVAAAPVARGTRSSASLGPRYGVPVRANGSGYPSGGKQGVEGPQNNAHKAPSGRGAAGNGGNTAEYGEETGMRAEGTGMAVGEGCVGKSYAVAGAGRASRVKIARPCPLAPDSARGFGYENFSYRLAPLRRIFGSAAHLGTECVRSSRYTRCLRRIFVQSECGVV